MFYKCNHCDPTITKKMRDQGLKPTKSINVENDSFVKDEKNKYYHIHCFKEHLRKRKKMNEEQIETTLEKRLEITIREMQESEERSNFLQWIMDFYDGSLPSYFLKKLKDVREGTYEGLNEPIEFLTLLDIYEHMANYLKKLAAKKQIQNVTQQMNYDLAVVVGNYGNYKRYKEKQKLEHDKSESATNAINEQEKVQTAINKKKDSQNDEFNLSDVLDDILL